MKNQINVNANNGYAIALIDHSLKNDDDRNQSKS